MTRKADVLLANLARKTYLLPNLAAGCLRAWASTDPNLSAVAIDALSQVATPAELADEIVARSPRIVGFSCYVWNYCAVLECVERLKRRRPDILTVVGGPEVAEIAEKVLRRNPSVDCVATGEGEETFRRLLNAVLLGRGDLADVPGIAYRDGERVVATKAPDLIDIKALPSPYLTGLVPLHADHPTLVIDGSRGCPFTCKFCDWGPRTMRYQTLERVEAELALLSRHTRIIQTTDADLLMTKERGVAVLEAFLRASAGSDCQIVFDVNPVFMAPEAVTVIAKDPQKFVPTFGLQSIHPEVLKRVNRVFKKDLVEANIADLRRRAASPLKFSVIFGLPGDDLAGFRATVEWTLRLRPTAVSANHALVLPGAEFAREGAALGLTFQEEPPHHVLTTDRMGPRDFVEARFLSFHVRVALIFIDASALLLALGDKIGGQTPHVAVIERWAEHLKRAGIDLTMGLPIADVDDYLLQERVNQAVDKMREDPALVQCIHVLTERFVAAARKDGLEAASAFALGAAA